MKRIALIFLLVPVFCFSQNKKALPHFWDITWGTSIEQAEIIFSERDLVSFREGNCLMAQAKYEGEDAMIMLIFNNANRLYSGNVIYPSSETTAIPKYGEYRWVFVRRYGMPDTVVEFFEEPYKKGDGREIEAIQTENAFYFTEWQFKDDCQASVSILKNLNVCLSFENPAYADSGIGKR